ncbi:hypothetical protein [Plantactinospora sp. CA-290183]|uniref:hypothetical protein n=1 Tax=Plantactinospora sp. CA-290183 TaxID=3240006 RepID=UPI003D8F9913
MTDHDQRYQRIFGTQINADTVHVRSSASADELLGYGMRAIAERLYPKAVELFTEAIAKGATGADPHYYLALALLGGRKPSRLGTQAQEIVPRVEEQLRRAIEHDPNAAHAYALWAAVKRDHYADRLDPGPPLAGLEARARTVDPVHAAEIAPLVSTQENPLWQAALTMARAGVEARRPNVHKYFVRTPNPPDLTGAQALMVTGGIGVLLAFVLTLVGIADTDSAGLLCLSVPMGIGAVYLLGKGGIRRAALGSAYARALSAAEPKPTDEQMDLWLHFDKFGLLDRALGNSDRSLDDLICEPQMADRARALRRPTRRSARSMRYGGSRDTRSPALPCSGTTGYRCSPVNGISSVASFPTPTRSTSATPTSPASVPGSCTMPPTAENSS